jgi:predicted RNA-binding protein with PIN domain
LGGFGGCGIASVLKLQVRAKVGHRNEQPRMNLLIDGHNLIGSNLFSDIRLSDKDDEAKLVRRLKIWHSRAKITMTVIFDRGIPGGIDVKMGGPGVEVIFAADPAQADDLIRRRLRRARQGLVLVTNDDALLRDAAAYGVSSWRGSEFVERMRPKVRDRGEAGTETEVQITKEEVDEWLALFKARWEATRAEKKRLAEERTKKPKQKPDQLSAQKPPSRAPVRKSDNRGKKR